MSEPISLPFLSYSSRDNLAEVELSDCRAGRTVRRHATLRVQILANPPQSTLGTRSPGLFILRAPQPLILLSHHKHKDHDSGQLHPIKMLRDPEPSEMRRADRMPQSLPFIFSFMNILFQHKAFFSKRFLEETGNPRV